MNNGYARVSSYEQNLDKQRRIYESLQELKKTGKRIEKLKILKNANLSTNTLNRKNVQWRIDSCNLIEKAIEEWNKHGGAEFTKGEQAIEELLEEGEMPDTRKVSARMGREEAFLSCRKTHEIWKYSLVKLIKKGEERYREDGGKEFIVAKKALQELKRENIRPSSTKVAKKIGTTAAHFTAKKRCNPWIYKLYKLIKEAQNEWLIANIKIQKSQKGKKTNQVKSSHELTKLSCLEVNEETLKKLYNRFIENKADIEEYRLVGVNFTHRKKPIVISFLMYSETSLKESNIHGKFVKPKSFSLNRKILLDALIKQIYNRGLSEVTLETIISSIFKFINFLNTNNFALPITLTDAREAYIQYSFSLREQYSHNNTAVLHQSNAKKYISTIFPDVNSQTHIFRGIKAIKKRRHSPTEISIDDTSYAISYYYNFFHKVSDILLNDLAFPQTISVNGKRMLIAPFGKKGIIPEDYRDKHDTPWLFYDIKKSELRNIKEVQLLIPEYKKNWGKKDKFDQKVSICNILSTQKTNEQRIKEINDNKNHPFHLNLATSAMQAFYLLLSGLTGMKDSELCGIEWGEDDNFKVKKGNVAGLVTIKPRANYREIESTISRVGINALRKALNLRRFLLQGNQCNRLFFKGYGENIRTDGNLLQGNYGQACIIKHMPIDERLKGIGTKKFKVFKNKIILRNTGGDLWIASAMVGNTPKVNADHYIQDNKKEKETQLATFVTSLIKDVKKRKNNGNTISSPQSECSNYKNPEPFIEGKRLDCKNIFACFFCKHYGIFPDKDDIHKLMSLQYIIRRIEIGRAYSQEQFDRVLKPVDDIIKLILTIMAKQHNAGAIINEVQTMVFKKSMLNSYWEFRLRYLYDLGAI